MNRTLLLAAALTAIPLAAWAQEQDAPAAEPLSPSKMVDTRQMNMGRGGSALAAMKQVMNSNGDLAALAPRIELLVQWSDELPTLFAESSRSAPSGARDTVWTDPAGFAAAAARFQAATRALAAPAAAGDRAAFQAAWTETRASCGNCHDNFKD